MSEPIRVLQVVTHMNRGGLETMLMNYYRHIDRNVIQFDFLTHRPYEGDYGKEACAMGAKLFHLPILNPFSRSYAKALGDFFDAHPEYDIIHVHQDCMSSVVLKIAKEHGVKVRIAHSHNANQDKNLKYIIKLICKRSIPKYATDLFACGKDAGDWMFDGAPFQIINNAICADEYIYSEEKRIKMRNQLCIHEDSLVIGHIGRFDEVKNHTFLVDVFVEILKTEPKAKLLLVGKNAGEIYEKLEKKIDNLGIRDAVIFTGLRSDVPDLLQAMDVFVFPSIYEGLPVTLVEAQASGLPCFVSDGIPTQSKIIDTFWQLPLNIGAAEWAESVLDKLNGFHRGDASLQIKKAKFDVSENAKNLQSFYLSELGKDG